MKKKFAAFDIDGTLFRSGLYRELARELMKMGAINQDIIDAVSEKNIAWRNRIHGDAFEEFEMVLVELFDANLPNLKIEDYEEAVRRVIKKRSENVYIFTRDLIKKLKSEGYLCIAISGSQVEMVELFAQRYGFDTWVGQEWERGDEYFTGNILAKTHTGKDKILRRLIEEHNLTLEGSYAVGDSNGDTGMLGMVDHPIAFNPTVELYDKAIANGWDIVIERKNMYYKLAPNNGSYLLAEAKHV